MSRNEQHSLVYLFAYGKLLHLVGQILDGNNGEEVQIQLRSAYIEYKIISKLYELGTTRQA